MARISKLRPGPLSDNHKNVIEQNLRALNELNAHFDRAEACGVDCQEMRVIQGQRTAMYQRLKETYFPGEP